MGARRKNKREGGQNVFEMIMDEKFPNLKK